MKKAEKKVKGKRGFASMKDKVRQSEIASMGGKKAHAIGHAHKFTPAEASAAAKRGWELRRARKAEAEKAGVMA